MAMLALSSEEIIVSLKDKAIVITDFEDTLKLTEIPFPSCGNTENRLTTADGSALIFCSAVSKSRKYFAASSNKFVYLWRLSDWTELGCRPLARAASSMEFSNSEKHLVVADKSGDAYLFQLDDFESGRLSNGQLLLGHVSMLLKVLLSHDDRFVVTCDRDEKIRVSHFPNAYNIKTFCLGHTDCVTCMRFLPSHPDNLVSGSADGTVRLWHFLTGRQICSYECPPVSTDTNDRPIIVDLATTTLDSCNYLISVIMNLTSFVRLLAVKLSDSACECSFYQDVMINSTAPRSLSAFADELLILSYKSPYISKFVLKENTFRASEPFNQQINSTIEKYADDFRCTSNNQDERLVSYFNKRKIDDAQDYYNRKKERLLGKSGEINV